MASNRQRIGPSETNPDPKTVTAVPPDDGPVEGVTRSTRHPAPYSNRILPASTSSPSFRLSSTD
eukprot:899123-Rhodomonas_salina.2